MDGKSRAEFINAVAAGKKPCANCNTLNEADSKFCEACGAPLSELPTEESDATQEAECTEKQELKAEGSEQKNEKLIHEKYIEPESVFAEGLPEWNIEPPQVVVRRKKR